MDYTPALQPPFDYLWFLIPLFIFAAVIKSPRFKAKAWEGVVNLAAKLSLDKIRYYPIKNVTLPTEDGTTQIDHIIVSQCGVFVVDLVASGSETLMIRVRKGCENVKQILERVSRSVISQKFGPALWVLNWTLARKIAPSVGKLKVWSGAEREHATN